MTLFSAKNDNSQRRGGIVSVLDIGSAKMSCIIAKVKPQDGHGTFVGRTHDMRVVGIGHQRSQGIKSGYVVDVERAEHAIRLTVDAAERMAGLTIDSLIVNVSAGRPTSVVQSDSVKLGEQKVSTYDVQQVIGSCVRKIGQPEREVLHAMPIEFTLDGEGGIHDPVDMMGRELGVNLHVLLADPAALRNIEHCINRAHLAVEQMVATPYASGLAALVGDEAEIGAACIDMGSGTTSLSVFASGHMSYASVVPVGGHHVTTDIARGLSIGLDDAERLKVMHGSVLPLASAHDESIGVLPVGAESGDLPQQISKRLLSEIVIARVEETLEMVRDKISESGLSHTIGNRIVLTGGACQLEGMTELARRKLGRDVRIGRPLGIAGLPAAAKGPMFSTAVGLMIYPQLNQSSDNQYRGVPRLASHAVGNKLTRIGAWLRQNF